MLPVSKFSASLVRTGGSVMLWQFLVTAIASLLLGISLVLVLVVLRLNKFWSKTVQQERSQNQTLVNLLTSRDPMTFQALQATSLQTLPSETIPMDDASEAARWATMRAAQGQGLGEPIFSDEIDDDAHDAMSELLGIDLDH